MEKLEKVIEDVHPRVQLEEIAFFDAGIIDVTDRARLYYANKSYKSAIKLMRKAYKRIKQIEDSMGPTHELLLREAMILQVLGHYLNRTDQPDIVIEKKEEGIRCFEQAKSYLPESVANFVDGSIGMDLATIAKLKFKKYNNYERDSPDDGENTRVIEIFWMLHEANELLEVSHFDQLNFSLNLQYHRLKKQHPQNLDAIRGNLLRQRDAHERAIEYDVSTRRYNPIRSLANTLKKLDKHDKSVE